MRLRGRPARAVAAAVFVLALSVPVSSGQGNASPRRESGSSDWRQLSAGASHTCGVRTTGRLYCWGSDSDGQLGDGGGAVDAATPTEVAGDVSDWTAVTAGDSHTCARRRTGALYCWGNDFEGQLGDGGTSTDQFTPTLVAGGVTTWTQVAAGAGHTCARRASGRLFCWGDDGQGQLGNGSPSAVDAGSPVQVAGNLTTWASVTAGSGQTCGRRSSGRLFCWGDDAVGQLGNGAPNADTAAPVEVAGAFTTWASVSAGAFTTCGRRTSGRVFCWGNDSFGQLGNGGPTENSSSPVQVAGGVTTWTSVTVGGFHACGRQTTGRLWCWGRDNDGQVGNGAPGTDRLTPVTLLGGATDWTTVVAGGSHTCARITTRRAYCWGNDQNGQLGNGSPTDDQFDPFEVQP